MTGCNRLTTNKGLFFQSLETDEVKGDLPLQKNVIVSQNKLSDTQGKSDRSFDKHLEKQLPSLALVSKPNTPTQVQIEQYLDKIESLGFVRKNQGIWIQTNDTLLANHQGTTPLHCASVAKIATTLVALTTLKADYRFVTTFGTTGKIENGVLTGDLIIQGGEDPFFVWEEAIAIANSLKKLGIQRVTGDLLVTGKFYMNFNLSPLESGKLFKQGINWQNWSQEAQTSYQNLPLDTPKPQIAIEGEVKVIGSTPVKFQPLLPHYSLPLVQLLKKMNRYSNNFMAAMINDTLGGKAIVGQKAATLTSMPTTEIQLETNQISPRATVGMLIAIEQHLQTDNMSVADVFTVIGQDESILQSRNFPPLAILKSGVWDGIRAIAGALPTEKSTIWLAVMNVGTKSQEDEIAHQQEVLLQKIIDHEDNDEFIGRKSKVRTGIE